MFYLQNESTNRKFCIYHKKTKEGTFNFIIERAFFYYMKIALRLSLQHCINVGCCFTAIAHSKDDSRTTTHDVATCEDCRDA